MTPKDRIIQLTQRLIQARSENPPGNEHEAAMIVKKELEGIGLEVSVFEYEKGRENIIGILKGKGKKTLLVNTHLDTVPAGAGWKHPPFEGIIEDNKIYGRGASDCKGNTASCIEAIRTLAKNKTDLGGTLIFAATVDEEMGSKNGLDIMMKKRIIKPDAAFIVDSADHNIDLAQKGLIHFTIKIFGKKAHGAYPHHGRNAIVAAAETITKLSSLKLKHTIHPLLSPPTINIGTIKGGEKINMVPDLCEFGVDIRFLPGMDSDDILASVKKTIETVTKDYELIVGQFLEPFEIDKNEPLVKCVFESIKEVRGNAKYAGVSGATMVTLFRDIGIPAVSTGFGINECMHATDEYAVIDDLVDGAKVVEKTIKKYFGV
ncbi:MAG: ArgE/DapE family deacylase [archaeon]